MNFEITRQNHMPFTKTYSQVEFLNGTTDVIIAVTYTSNCGCLLEFGMRMDKPTIEEKSCLFFACDKHHGFNIPEAVMDNKTDTTDVAFKKALESLRRG